MSDTILDYDGIIDYRYNPFTETWDPKKIGYGLNPAERRTIPNSAPYWIKLYEGIQENAPSTTNITLVVGGTTLSEVAKSRTPSDGQYRVNYDERGHGIIEFNSAQKGLQVDIQYYGLGSLFQKLTLDANFARRILETYANNYLKCEVVPIGDWDMSTATGPGRITVAHGLDWTKIRVVDILVRNDADTLRFPIRTIQGAVGGNTMSGSGVAYIDSTNIALDTYNAVNHQFFDGADYSATSYNRGWLIIWYEE